MVTAVLEASPSSLLLPSAASISCGLLVVDGTECELRDGGELRGEDERRRMGMAMGTSWIEDLRGG